MPWKQHPLPDDPALPVRLPRNAGGQGTLGRPLDLRSNYFEIKFSNSNIILHHYDVKIEELSKDDDEHPDKKPGAVALPVGMPAPAAGADAGGKGKRRKKGRAKGPKGGAGAEAAPEETGSQGAAAAGGGGGGDPPADASAKTGIGKERRIPKAKRVRIYAAFMLDHARFFGGHRLAYDGEANAYSASKPPQFRLNDPIRFPFTFDDKMDCRKRSYIITLQLVATAPLAELLLNLPKLKPLPVKSQTVFQMLEVMFNYQRTVDYCTVGRNQFYSQRNQDFGDNYDISGDKQGVIGFYCSLRARCGWKDAGGLFLNLDVSHTAFYKVQPLLKFLHEIRILGAIPSDLLDYRTISDIEKEVVKKDIRVVTTHCPAFERRYKVTGVSKDNCLTHTFPYEENGTTRTVNIVQYFRERYNYHIRYPKLNCIQVGNKGTLLPMEVCKIAPNQRVKGKLKDEEIASFIRQTAVKPNERFEKVKRILNRNQFPQDPFLQSLGVSLTAQPVDVKGRLLDPPVVELNNNVKARVDNGQWRADRDRYFSPVALTEWAVLNFSRTRDLNKFIDQLVNSARSRGMNASNPFYVSRPMQCRADETVRHLTEVCQKNPNVQIIVCVIEKGGDHYKIIKETGDRVLHVITQCVLSKNAFVANPATVGNILLKINAKIGGVNHRSLYSLQPYHKLFAEPILVMGADVNHPAAADTSTPSLVAVVGSLDRNACRYAVEVRHQGHRKEMITEMEAITTNLLKQFYSSARAKPTRIVMYRDGVSETQFNQVVAYELKAMRDACMKLEAGYQPTMTFICVQKRHHTRLYVANPQDGDRNGNVKAGTVVDHVITSASNRDFFLCSHAGIQGTSKPSHYTVLWDDCDLTMDQLQLLTFALCHNYARCFRSVSIPTPVYYAHLAAARAKVHLEGAVNKYYDKFRRSAAQSATGTYKDEDLSDATRVERSIGLSNQMFYHLAITLKRMAEELEKSAENNNGPDQVLPASSHKCWKANAAVTLQMSSAGPASAKPMSVYSFLHKVADQYPTQKALAVKRDGEWTYWSYEDYFKESCMVAKAFIELGLEPHKGVCIMGFNSPEWLLANFGGIFAGGITTGVYTTNSPDACLHLAKDCDTQIVVVENEKYIEKFLAIKQQLPSLKALVQWSGTPTTPGVISWRALMQLGAEQPDETLQQRLRQQAVNQCCTLIYTSGTTGPPKGVMCSQDNLTWTGQQWGLHTFNLNICDERLISYLPLSHLAAQMTEIYMAVSVAATVYFAMPDALRGSLGVTMKEVQPTGFLGVPRVWEKIHEKMTEVASSSSSFTKMVAGWAKYHGLNYHRALQHGRSVPRPQLPQGTAARQVSTTASITTRHCSTADPTLRPLSLYESLQYNLARTLVLNRIKDALGLGCSRNFVSDPTLRPLSLYESLQYNLARTLVLNRIKDALGLGCSRNFVSGSAPIGLDVLEFFMSLDMPIMEGYGLSESLSVGAIGLLKPDQFKPGSCGKVLNLTAMKLLESEMANKEQEGEGEICFKGRNIFMGYLNLEDKTHEAIDDEGWLKSGDLGWLDSEGFLYVSGRVKELVITAGGENIPPVIIEEAIKKQLPFISNAMLIGDKRKFLSILLTAKCKMDDTRGSPLETLAPAVTSWCNERGLHISTVAEFQKESDNRQGVVAQAIQAAIDTYNRDLAISNAQRVQRWMVLSHDFSLATGELNNTLKLKRSVAAKLHADIIEEMYSDNYIGNRK
ncbi:Argonaute linker 2 domain [Trinorchestia longiramus]|nr:Argonaute linker 2 domain [Trinorchestia longiramus]